ncbi:MAG: polyribonucleotide nucleotidyltransferase, partial [Armatimonadetes bacterium]|nr:polyribonucleotide nucleotidyltransferase [Armatimonadota bacterium]
MSVARVEMDLGDRVLSIETGKLAIQAHGAVVVRAGDTMCLVTACTSDAPRPGIDFFPLTVDYEERLYAAGKIPGSFFRREGRPTEGAILTSRLTDRGLRPLFPDGMRSDVQIIATALSTDQESQIDILCMIGASAALAISGIDFPTPLGSMRVGLSQDDEWVVYPTHSEEDELVLDLVVSSTRDHVMMIEAGSDGVDEETIVEGCAVAQEQCWRVIDMIEELKQKVEITPRAAVYVKPDEDILAALDKAGAAQRFDEALRVEGFDEQRLARKDARSAIAEELFAKFGEEKVNDIDRAIDACLKKA